MAYIFFFLFLFFSIVDYIYLYSYFDSKIFMKTSGSKLRYLLRDEENKIKAKKSIIFKFKKYSLKQILSYMIFILIINLIYLVMFNKVFFSDFVIVDLGYKKIEMVSTFDKYWRSFLIIDIVLFNLLIPIVYTKVLSSYNRKDKKDMYKVENGLDKAKIYVGKSDKEEVYLNKEELYKNLLITGSIGTGKTSSGINKFCRYMIENNISGLIIDIKGNYVDTVNKMISENQNCELIIISEESKVIYNPINQNVRNLEMANRLRKVIELISTSNSSDSYWLDKVENVLFNFIVLIKYISPNKLDLNEIHKLVTDDEYLNTKLRELKNMALEVMQDKQIAHEINNVIMFFSKEYFNLDKRVISIIKSEITRLTIPFITEYEVCHKFGVKSKDEINISFDKNKQKIYLLSINMSKNFLLSKMLATFIKLEFQSYVLENITNPKECFCICDEYQEFANVQDAHFLSLSREAKCMNIFSMQSYSSLINILKNEQAAKVVIQNLVNKMWFRNDDNYTVKEILNQIGRERKVLKTNTVSEGATESKKSIFGGFRNSKSNISESVSYAENNDYIYESNVLSRDLETFEALVLFGENGKMSDVKRVKLM